MLHDPSNTKDKISLALAECAGWITTLNLLKEESYALKTKLSEALDHQTEKDLVAEAENFHNLILLRDEYIKEISADTRKQERNLREAFSKNIHEKQWTKQQQKLRNEVTYLEKDFEKMKDDFYKRFLKKISP